MPYDERIETAIMKAATRWAGVEKKKMFGGICILLNGNMALGVWKEYLVVRVGPEAAAAALREPGAKPFDVTGTPLKGWVMVDESGWGDPGRRKAWLKLGRDFALSLPAKPKKAPKPKKKK